MATLTVLVMLAMSMLVTGEHSDFTELLQYDYGWETRQDWPDCCQYSSVVRAFLCSDCSPPIDDVPDDIPEDCVIVDLSFNSVPYLPIGKFNHLSELQFLVLPHNRIGLVEPGAFDGVNILGSLDLEDNLLTEVPDNFPTSITSLEMKGNPVNYVNATSLSRYTSLADLSLSTVELGPDTFADLSLDSLEIFTCHIHRYGFRLLDPTYDVNLISPCPSYLSEENRLILEPYAFANLGGELNLSSNVEINIEDTTISEIPFGSFFSLGSEVTSIHMGSIDGLESIQPGAFSHNPSLQSINITGKDGTNRLTLHADIITGYIPNLSVVDLSDLGTVDSIHAGLFDNLEALRHLYLDGLDLTYIAPAVLLPVEEQLENLNVGNNPYRCDCNMRWMKEMLDRGDFEWFPEGTTCGSPPELAGMRFDELDAADFDC